MFIEYFIKRPVLTSVCAILILLVGVITIPTLPVAQYPQISPKQVQVTATYIGADAVTVENAVTTVLEREINGVDGMRYMTSSSSNDGVSSITVTFDASSDQNIAAVDVQNRVSIAEPQLPEAVLQTGVSVSKESSGPPLLAFGLFSESGTYNDVFLSNYADLYLVDALQRVPGVGNVAIFGERKYAMRLWLDPGRLASRGLTASDVADALLEQNIQVGVGRIGQPPIPDDQEFQIGLRAVSRLKSIEEFENLVLAASADGTLVKLRDVGRAELGAENYNTFLRFRGIEAVGLGIYQVPGSNALQVARGIKQRMRELSEEFPAGMTYDIGFDTTDFVEQSLTQVIATLFQAVGLVVLVIFVFLQDWRTTLIPAITIPVALLGTFAFVKLFGFSINSLTLFGLTLATGMVVDDAIVVVEDISTKIQKLGMTPRQAAIESMRELFGAVIATSLVLMAVFVPVAFFPGTTGALYRQFALTIAFAIGLSTFNAVTLTPTLSALLLRSSPPVGGWVGRIFGAFNHALDSFRRRYRSMLESFSHLKSFLVGVFIVLLAATAWMYAQVPSAFLPEEDQGYIITIVGGPAGSSLSYTSQVMRQIEEIYLPIPEVRATFAVGGFGFSGSVANSGIVFTTLEPWSERTGHGQSASEIIERVREQLANIPEANVLPLNPPTIQGLGSFGGFTFQLQDQQGSFALGELVQYMGQMLGAANQHPDLQAVFSTYSANTPQMLVEVDRDRAKALDVDVDDIFETLQSYLGSRYVNDFTLARRTYRVYIQADEPFRDNPNAIEQFYVRSNRDELIPLGNLVTLTPTTGAQSINHYNVLRSIEINGKPAPGASSGQAIAAMEQVAAEVLPQGLGYEWSGQSREEIQSGGQAPLIFGLGLLLVFLVLAAQYESYIDPAVIMIAVPLAVLGALVALSLRGFPNDVYGQIGLVMLIGLASKNSILIVEFANQLHEQGLSISRAAIEAAEQRLRPILMTAISTLSSIFPLVVATGAGAGSRQSLGTAVFGGMFAATFLSLGLVPVLYIIIKTLAERALNKFDRNRMPPHALPESNRPTVGVD
ncbi:hydrophobe/amphiphile efflux-1 (HAE1) Family [Rubidibacter lacunae KORDI 51-2]|uniref:Hydrophobe/amphiphile efflux-1 (HAE1) Family n=1 Tax=Rubidibacter lacunae KORDI 51-2 TaxID=582515 RepID=U5D638_9CHRO|nr:efflux RND transporter permease subunit [Rubidibacter lacunae]ERN40088.1 hydrophobe/amphiphile efflux-1 (HAE1) Family [Rubidibacter lacunae KORDI 51-2]